MIRIFQQGHICQKRGLCVCHCVAASRGSTDKMSYFALPFCFRKEKKMDKKAFATLDDLLLQRRPSWDLLGFVKKGKILLIDVDPIGSHTGDLESLFSRDAFDVKTVIIDLKKHHRSLKERLQLHSQEISENNLVVMCLRDSQTEAAESPSRRIFGRSDLKAVEFLFRDIRFPPNCNVAVVITHDTVLDPLTEFLRRKIKVRSFPGSGRVSTTILIRDPSQYLKESFFMEAENKLDEVVPKSSVSIVSINNLHAQMRAFVETLEEENENRRRSYAERESELQRNLEALRQQQPILREILRSQGQHEEETLARREADRRTREEKEARFDHLLSERENDAKIRIGKIRMKAREREEERGEKLHLTSREDLTNLEGRAVQIELEEMKDALEELAKKEFHRRERRIEFLVKEIELTEAEITEDADLIINRAREAKQRATEAAEMASAAVHEADDASRENAEKIRIVAEREAMEADQRENEALKAKQKLQLAKLTLELREKEHQAEDWQRKADYEYRRERQSDKEWTYRAHLLGVPPTELLESQANHFERERTKAREDAQFADSKAIASSKRVAELRNQLAELTAQYK